MLARVPLLLVPLLSPRPLSPCMMANSGCDDGCSVPEESNPERQPLDQLAFMPDELSVLSLPDAPDPSLSHTDVVEAVCRGLQHPDVPSAKAGHMRLFKFCTYDCKVCCAPGRIAAPRALPAPCGCMPDGSPHAEPRRARRCRAAPC